MCTYAMGYLQGLIEKKETKEEIENAVKTMCRVLPGHYREQCQTMVSTYGDMIIDYLMDHVHPSEICQKIGLCSGISKKVYNRAHHRFMLGFKLPKGVSCTVCTYAMGYFDSILTDKRVEKKIEQEVVQLCSHLPYTFKNECDALITEYGDTLVELLVSELNPSKVCTALKVCPWSLRLWHCWKWRVDVVPWCLVVITSMDLIVMLNMKSNHPHRMWLELVVTDKVILIILLT